MMKKNRIIACLLMAAVLFIFGVATNSKVASAGSYNSSYAKEVVKLVNKERTKRGLKKLTMKNDLNKVAKLRAKETVKLFSHTRPNGKDCFSAFDLKKVSYHYAGENIAYGQRTPKEVVKGWMNSKPHKKNILSKDFTRIGVGAYKSDGVYYWTQNFAG